MHQNDMIRIGILEDNIEFSDHLCRIIAEDDEMELVFVVDSVVQSLFEFEEKRPDLLLVDMQLPDGSGLDLVNAACNSSDSKVMILTVLADRASVLSAFENGADGYLLKDTTSDQIKRNIHAVMGGASPVSPAAATHILGFFKRIPRTQVNPEALPTARELDVLQMISKGMSYAETASALGLSVHTVRDHVKAIYRKLAVNSKNEAVFEARQLGWLKMFD